MKEGENREREREREKVKEVNFYRDDSHSAPMAKLPQDANAYKVDIISVILEQCF